MLNKWYDIQNTSFNSIFFIRLRSHACKAKLTVITDENGVQYKRNKADHTHINDVREKMVQERLDKAKIAAKITNSPRDLYAQSLSGLPDGALVQMPRQNAFGKTIRNARKGDHPKVPKKIDELVLENITTSTGQNFLFHDSGVENEKDRLVSFATDQSLNFLAKCDEIFMDGTVKKAPALFDQMYTIHGKNILYLIGICLVRNGKSKLNFMIFVISISIYLRFV